MLFGGLGVFRMRYEGEEPFSLSLLEGARRLRVLTYSADEVLVRQVALSVGEMEVILGHPIPATGLDRLLALQTLALEEVQGRLQGDPELLERLREGKLRFYLSREPSHAKLFLVEREEGRYALLGSANFSGQALRGRQLEILLKVEDPEGYARLEALYEEVKGGSDPVKRDLLLLPKVPPEALPLLEAAGRKPIVLQVEKEVPAVYRVELIPQRAKPFRALAEEVRPKGGGLKLEPRHIRLVAPKEPEDPGLFRVGEEGLEVLGKVEPYLEVGDEGVYEDARRMVAFLEAYRGGAFLYEEEAEAQVRAYFRLWAWFWTSPLMHRLLRRAHLEGELPHAYPLYALVYGKANTGKTTFLRLLGKSLTGKEIALLTAQDLGKAALRSLQLGGSELPLVFDDVPPGDIREKVEPVIKEFYETPRGLVAPAVFSLNAGQDYAPPDEVKKRAFLVWTGAVLDTTRPDRVRALHREAHGLIREVGNRLYRAFLPRLLQALEGEEAPDWLGIATRELGNLLAETLGKRPDWAEAQDLDGLSLDTLRKVQAKLGELLKVHPLDWSGGKPKLRLGKDTWRYGRELPGWLVEEVQGEVLILKAKGLEKLGLGRGRRFRLPWWG